MGIVDYDDSASDSETGGNVVVVTVPKSKNNIKTKFVDSSIPTFIANKQKTLIVNDENISPPFEFGDVGHTWRQIKIDAFAENLSRGIHSLNSIVNEEYPQFIQYDGKFTKDDKVKVLNQYSTIWEIAFILLEKKYLSSPANLTIKVISMKNDLLKLRFKSN